MNAEIETSTSFSNAVPEESIVNFEGKDFVFVEEKTDLPIDSCNIR
jgi:cobalt-zinc-cadmium efflux system membrane fusion protein